MKKLVLICAFSAALLAACTKQEPFDGDRLIDMSFAALGDTKAVLNSDLGVEWVSGDAVGVYDGTAFRQFTAASSGASTTLDGSALDASKYTAIYPYASTATFDADVIGYNFPASQVLNGASVAPGALLSVAESTSEAKSFAFKNVVSLLKMNFNASDKIVKVEFEGRNNESVAGAISIYVDATAPSCSIDEGTPVLSLSAQGDAVLEGDCYLTVLPQNFTAGFKLTFYNQDGKVAEKNYGAAQFVRNGGKNIGTVQNLVWKNALKGRLVATSSSTAVFEWTESNFSSVAEDIAHPYTIALYKDAACSDLLVSWNIEASSALYNSKQPRFVFTGLSANTSYYFVVTDTGSSVTSTPVSVTTAQFTTKTLGTATAAVGDVILAEDFSELVWGTDEYNVAMGYTALTTSAANMTPATGANPTDTYKLCKAGDYNALFSTFANSVANTRLADWGTICFNSNAATTTNSKVAARGGCIMLNTWSGGSASMVTPALTCLGSIAKLRVSFSAAMYSASDTNAAEAGVFILDASSTMASNHLVSYGSRVQGSTVNLTTTMQDFSVDVDNVSPDSRLAIGPTSIAGSKARIYLDNIKVEVLEYKSYPISAEAVMTTSSTATFKWSENGYTDLVADLANDYTIGIYTDAACASPVVTWDTNVDTFTYKKGQSGEEKYQPCFVFTGLASNTSYYFRVHDTTNDKYSNTVAITTASFSVVEPSSTPVAAGGILLAEDFSQCVWGSDEIFKASGYESRTFSTDANMTPATGNSPTDAYRFYPYKDYHSMFYWYKTPVQNTRYKDWSYLSYLSSALQNDGTSTSDTQWDKKVNVRAGYIMLGTWSNGNGILVTPALNNLSGKAKINVSYKGARYSTDDHNGIVVYYIAPGATVFTTNCGLDPSSVTITMQGKQWLWNNTEIVGKSGAELWQSFSKDVPDCEPGCRIGIGPCNKTGKGERMYIDDIVIKVVSYNE